MIAAKVMAKGMALASAVVVASLGPISAETSPPACTRLIILGCSASGATSAAAKR